jgi:hypothetical protein
LKRDIAFGSDMPAGVGGEYNITVTVRRNITFACRQKYHAAKAAYHLKFNGYTDSKRGNYCSGKYS